MNTTRWLAFVRFFGLLWLMSLRASLALRGAFFLRVAFMAANNLIYFVFWWLLFARVPSVSGYALPQMATLFGVLAASVGLSATLAGGVHQLGRMVEDGELDAILAQPKPTLPYAIGMRCQASGFGDVLSGALLMFGPGGLSLQRAPLVLVVMLCSAVVFTSCAAIVYSSSFWFGRNDALARQVVDSTITFGCYPDGLFAGPLRLLLFTLVPAGFVSFIPARLVQAASGADASLLALGTLAYAAGAFWCFERGLARYSSGSRFTGFG